MRRLPHKLNDLRSVLVMDNPPCATWRQRGQDVFDWLLCSKAALE